MGEINVVALFRRLFTCICIIYSLHFCIMPNEVNAKEVHKAKIAKYTVFEGQTYYWNRQMKKYIPIQSPYERMQLNFLKQQLNGMGSPVKTQPTRIKWWDFYYN